MKKFATWRTLILRKVVAWVVLMMLAGGCAETSYVTLRGVPHNPLADVLAFRSKSGPQPSSRTMQFLRSYDLVGDLKGDPQALLGKVQQIIDREPSPDGQYAIAELAYVSGAKLQAKKDLHGAMDLYGAAVAHAYLFLLDPALRGSAQSLRSAISPRMRGV